MEEDVVEEEGLTGVEGDEGVVMREGGWDDDDEGNVSKLLSRYRQSSWQMFSSLSER